MSDDAKRHASNCKYVRPTLLQPRPEWLEAARAPWTCVRTSEPRLLTDTEVCEDCPFWEERPASPAKSE